VIRGISGRESERLAPLANRSGKSVREYTQTSPCSPCGLEMYPTVRQLSRSALLMANTYAFAWGRGAPCKVYPPFACCRTTPIGASGCGYGSSEGFPSVSPVRHTWLSCRTHAKKLPRSFASLRMTVAPFVMLSSSEAPQCFLANARNGRVVNQPTGFQTIRHACSAATQ